MRRGGKPAKAKVDAKPVRARTSLKTDDSRVRDLEKRLAEALEQQTATAELLQTRNRELTQALERETASADLLRIISASPTDLAPVFETILDRALSLCDATLGGVARYDGSLVSVEAVKGPPALAEALRAVYPRRLTDPGLGIRSIRERITLNTADVRAESSSI